MCVCVCVCIIFVGLKKEKSKYFKIKEGPLGNLFVNRLFFFNRYF